MKKSIAETKSAQPPAVAGFTIEVGQGAVRIDEAAYPARIAAVLDLGIQAPPSGFNGGPRRQYAVGFELQGATCLGVEPEAPPVMFRRYNQSWGIKAELPKLLRAILGRDVQYGEKLSSADWIGKPVTCTVEHVQRPDGSTSARIASVTRCALKALPELVAEPLVYPGGVALAALPEWAQTAIDGALHASSASTASANGDGYDADLPQ